MESGAVLELPKLDKSALKVSTGVLASQVCFVETVQAPSQSLPDKCKNIGNSFAREFRKATFFTFNSTEYNQPRGKLLQSQIYKTAISPKPFAVFNKPKKDLNLFMGVALDVSGSMNDIISHMSNVCLALLYGCKCVNIATEFCAFESYSYKLKDIGETDLETTYGRLYKVCAGGGTNMLPNLEYYYSTALTRRAYKDRCLLVFTDGATNDAEECADIVKLLRKQGFFVYCVGLRLHDSDYSCCCNIFGREFVANYSNSAELYKDLPPDLIKLISKHFMLNS